MGFVLPFTCYIQTLGQYSGHMAGLSSGGRSYCKPFLSFRKIPNTVKKWILLGVGDIVYGETPRCISVAGRGRMPRVYLPAVTVCRLRNHAVWPHQKKLWRHCYVHKVAFVVFSKHISCLRMPYSLKQVGCLPVIVCS